MAALNLAHDFQRRPASASSRREAPAEAPLASAALAVPRSTAWKSPHCGRRIAGMQSAIDQILPAKEKLF
jgi:hypothetical protein